jgi:hypothetical protein
LTSDATANGQAFLAAPSRSNLPLLICTAGNSARSRGHYCQSPLNIHVTPAVRGCRFRIAHACDQYCSFGQGRRGDADRRGGPGRRGLGRRRQTDSAGEGMVPTTKHITAEGQHVDWAHRRGGRQSLMPQEVRGCRIRTSWGCTQLNRTGLGLDVRLSRSIRRAFRLKDLSLGGPSSSVAAAELTYYVKFPACSRRQLDIASGAVRLRISLPPRSEPPWGSPRHPIRLQ